MQMSNLQQIDQGHTTIIAKHGSHHDLAEMASTAAQAPTAATQPGPYDHLPDLPADISMDTDSSTRPTFEQLNATLISRGYLCSPLNVAGIHSDSLATLSDALHAMIAQREEDIEVRTALTAKNRTLTASLERAKRFHKEELECSADFERKAEALKSKLAHLTTQLETERNAHKATKEALGRLRRDLQAIKASAVQYKAANDRSVARVRARIGEVTTSAIRSAVPDFQIVASAFDEPPAASSSKAGAAGVYAQQVQELEQKRAHLVEYNQALKRFATEAINAARRADQELADMVEAEEDDAKKRDATPAAKTNGDSSGSRSASSSSVSSMGASKRSASNDAWLDGHQALFQRDLFPANDTLRSTSSGTLVSGTSSKVHHPALRALELTSAAISSHVQSLLDLRTERNIFQATQSQRLAAEARELAWTAKLEHDTQQDLENDARLSLNKTNGPSHVGSLASAAVAASSGSSNGGTSHRIDWQREKADLEKKLAQLVKQVAVAEENMARKEKEVKKLAEAEQRARALLDQTSSSATAQDSKAALIADAAQQADSLRSELQAAEQERARLAQRCELLEAETRELRNDHNRKRSERTDPSHVSKVTSLKRLDEGEVAEIHARDQQRRNDIGRLSVVAEDAELPSLTGTADVTETASEHTVEKLDTSISRRSTRKGRLSKESADAGATSFGESFGNNPELDAIFGLTSKSVLQAGKRSTRRSSRLSGSSAVVEEITTPEEVEQAEVEQATQPTAEGRKRKASRDEAVSPQEGFVSSASRKRTSRRISGGTVSRTASDEPSPRVSKRARDGEEEPIKEPITLAAVAPEAAALAAEAAAHRSRRRLSTREKQELEQKPKSATLPSSKTPAFGSRRIVSGSSSSVTRPTAASLRRSEATQASVKRPLSNTTNLREASTQRSASSKTPARVVSSGSVRARS